MLGLHGYLPLRRLGVVAEIFDGVDDGTPNAVLRPRRGRRRGVVVPFGVEEVHGHVPHAFRADAVGDVQLRRIANGDLRRVPPEVSTRAGSPYVKTTSTHGLAIRHRHFRLALSCKGIGAFIEVHLEIHFDPGAEAFITFLKSRLEGETRY